MIVTLVVVMADTANAVMVAAGAAIVNVKFPEVVVAPNALVDSTA